jgi:hypothetical protein
MSEAEAPGDRFDAIYYPFSRCLDENTLKRAILLYDRVVFIDPKTPKVRAGLYSVEQHMRYLPDRAAHKLAEEWDEIASRYQMLEAEGAIGFFDPAPLLANSTVDALITAHLDADMRTPPTFSLPPTAPKAWSILRSRIPKSAFKKLHHQHSARVLYPENIKRPFTNGPFGPGALFSDGKPDQDMSNLTAQRRIVEETEAEYACVVPYYLGSSLAVSTGLAAAAATGAVPITDSAYHHRLLAQRFARAAERQQADGMTMPGLAAEPRPGADLARGLIQLRLFDTVLSAEELSALTLEECLEYRARTEKARSKFRGHVKTLTERAREGIWSPAYEDELRSIQDEAQKSLHAHRTELKEAYKEIARKAVVAGGLAGASALVATPLQVPTIAAFIGGAAAVGAFLKQPLEDLATLWSKRLLREKHALAYLFELKAAAKE